MKKISVRTRELRRFVAIGAALVSGGMVISLVSPVALFSLWGLLGLLFGVRTNSTFVEN